MPVIDLARDRNILNRAVHEAGKEVLARFGLTTHSWAKDDDSPVSEADHAANDILYEHLVVGHEKQYGFLSEESAECTHRLSAARTWIVDPIDGTRAFLNGVPHFTVCVALIEENKPILSAVYNPATDEFFEAILDGGAFLNGQPIQTSTQTEIEGCSMLAHAPMFSHPKWPEKWPPMHVEQVNSTSYRIALVASGQYDATMALLPKSDWDMAPGALIAKEAGAIITDHTGAELTYNLAKPIQRSLVCAGPKLYSQILQRVSHLPEDLTKLRATSRERI